MRYQELREFSDALDDKNSKQNFTNATKKTDSNIAVSKVSNNDVKSDNNNNNNNNNLSAIKVAQFIERSIPPEFTSSQSTRIRNYLNSQIRSVNDIRKYDSQRILLALRAIDLSDGIDNRSIESSNIDKLSQYRKLSSDATITTSDNDAISRLVANSKRVTADVIVTVLSKIQNSTMAIEQSILDILSQYIGIRFRANYIENKINSEFSVERGAYIIFRNLRDPDVYINVLLDTDRGVIRAGLTVSSLRLMTAVRDGRVFLVDRYRDLVVDDSNITDSSIALDSALFNASAPILERYQELMNANRSIEIYRELGIEIPDTAREKIKQDRPELANRIISK